MKPALVLVLFAPLAACTDATVCDDDVPPGFGEPIVIAEMPLANTLPRAVLGDDRSLIVWSEVSAEPGVSFLRARCIAPDGSAITAGEVAVPIDGYVNTETVTRGAGGAYHVIYGVWAATATSDPITHLAIDLDCAGTDPTPREILGPQWGTSVRSLVATGAGYAFLFSTPDSLSLAVEDAGRVTLTELASPPIWGTLAYHDGTIAFITLIASGVVVTTYGLDGAPRLGPVALAGTSRTYDGQACWDGDGWSLAVNTRDAGTGEGEIRFTRVAADGVPRPTPVMISNGTGRSYDAAIACGTGTEVIAFRRNIPGNVPGTDLVVATIELVEITTDGTVIDGPLEIERPGARLPMFPTVAKGARFVATWTAFDEDGYEQRWASTGDRCDR